MSDLSLAQNHAFDLAGTLMVPVTLFEIDGEIGVMPSAEYDGDGDAILNEYIHLPTGRLIEPITPSGRRAARADARARDASPRAYPADLHIANRALARFHLRGLGAASPNRQES
ncbi:hypothetical protein HFN80_32660 [Rhizobium laguerreae]|uniref:hypothetical protein n=1 Tax=Rhizobium laguerreae TaxID=1076926 RepID=UPI001C911BD3|nr:hypothetical protein [Rhizobium laguerreae]MBY3468678.1 hypothetical protein [Rhizobium laguerreae]